jgi:hypothetical protein
MKFIAYISAFLIILLSSCTKQDLVIPKCDKNASAISETDYSRTSNGIDGEDDEPDSVIGGDEKEEDDDNDSSGNDNGKKIIKTDDNGPGSVIGGDEKEDDDDNDSRNK